MIAQRPLVLLFVGVLTACGAASAGTTSTSSVEANRPMAGTGPSEGREARGATGAQWDTARGGRLFDNWRKELKSSFVPDAKNTPGVADGSGGPSNDGTLRLASGEPVLNDAGHDYRLKNWFGWDLRGKAGMYGPSHMNKKTALDVDLFTWTGSVAELADRLERGEGPVPALGPVMPRAELEALAAFIVAQRDGTLPTASSVLTLTSPEAKDYALKPGGDAERGKRLIAERCAGCHGSDGTDILIDDGEFSLGSHARQKAYEDWFKILNGQPGTAMGRQVRGNTAQEMAQELLDILTALCDRKAFPLGKAKGKDVEDGDPRCGPALR